MRIVIETVPAQQMRYSETLGDWFYRPCPEYKDVVCEVVPHELVIQVSDAAGAANYQFLIALHELVEAKLCDAARVRQEEVDKFDMETWPALWAAEQAQRGRTALEQVRMEDLEPGDHPEAPYRKQHRFAMLIEHLVARELGLHDYGVVR